MEVSYQLYLTLILIPAFIATLSYAGYVIRFIYLVKSSDNIFKFSDILTILSIGAVLGFSLFLSLGMTLPSLNYPR